MDVIWFGLLAMLLTAYVVLDGFDLGAGAIHWWVARNEEERAQVIRAIGPVWDGNEVCLIAAGGTLFLAFPKAYAVGLSGFYLPLMVSLWLLILRGLAIELRGHLENRLWKRIWDVVFAGSSALLVLCLGAALGNVVRGVPLDGRGEFFTPLWSGFGRQGVAVFDPYTLLVSALALLALAWHGAHWIAYRTGGPVQRRARRTAQLLWGPVLVTLLTLSWLTFVVQPHVARRMGEIGSWLTPALALLGLGGARWQLGRKNDGRAFLGSSIFLIGLMGALAVGMFPYLLPSTIASEWGLTVKNAAAAPASLEGGLRWWIPGMLLVVGYFTVLYRQVRQKVEIGGASDAH